MNGCIHSKGVWLFSSEIALQFMTRHLICPTKDPDAPLARCQIVKMTNNPRTSRLLLSLKWLQPPKLSTLSTDCPECSKTFLRKYNLTRHKLKEHKLTKVNLDVIKKSGNSDKNYSSQMCGSDFGDNCEKLELHMIYKACQKSNKDQVLDGKGLFKCTICDKRLSNSFNLSCHIKWKHSASVRSFKCPHCDSTFKWDRSRKKHIEKKHSWNYVTYH